MYENVCFTTLKTPCVLSEALLKTNDETEQNTKLKTFFHCPLEQNSLYNHGVNKRATYPGMQRGKVTHRIPPPARPHRDPHEQTPAVARS